MTGAIVLGATAAACLVAASALLHRPAFQGAPPATPATAAAARRFVTKVAALHDAGSRAGAWDMAFSEIECNAWLADDLPRRHPGLLPRGFADPRVRLSPGTVDVAVSLTEAAPLPAWLVGAMRPVVTLRLEVRLAAIGRLECRLVSARIGAVPLPTGPLVRGIADGLRSLGLSSEPVRVDGRNVLVVTLPSDEPGRPAVRVAALAVGDRELLVAGTTVERQ